MTLHVLNATSSGLQTTGFNFLSVSKNQDLDLRNPSPSAKCGSKLWKISPTITPSTSRLLPTNGSPGATKNIMSNAAFLPNQ